MTSKENIDAGKEENSQPMRPTDQKFLQYQRAFGFTAATVRLCSTFSIPHHKTEKQFGMNVYGSLKSPAVRAWQHEQGGGASFLLSHNMRCQEP